MLNTGNSKVFVNGCFDVLHYGHLKLLEFAKKQANYLIVGIDSDSRVKKAKGPTRPHNNQKIRKYFLESLIYVDEVVIFNSDEELVNLVKKTRPQVMIVGEEYKNKKVIGSQYATEVKFFERIGKHSTTNILQDFANR